MGPSGRNRLAVWALTPAAAAAASRLISLATTACIYGELTVCQVVSEASYKLRLTDSSQQPGYVGTSLISILQT